MKEGLIGFVFLAVVILMIYIRCKSRSRVRGNEQPQAAGTGRENVQAYEQKLREQLIIQEKKLWEIKAAAPYEGLFDQCVMSLQMLLGTAGISKGMLSEEQADYYVWDVIAGPLLKQIQAAGGKAAGKRLQLPVQAEPFEEARVKAEVQKASAAELERYLREDALRLKTGEIALQKKQVIQGLGNVLARLQGMRRDCPPDYGLLGRLAAEVQELFEQNGIYPMYASDQRLDVNPELRKRFIPLNANSIRYPGLFIRKDGVWQVLGANIGMDSREVKKQDAGR